jgi:IPT/TIG domain
MTPVGKAKLNVRRLSVGAKIAEPEDSDFQVHARFGSEVMSPMKYTSRSLVLIVLLGALYLSCSAQSTAPSNSSDINARIATLNAEEKSIPDNQIELSDELRRIDDELARRRAELASYDAVSKQLDDLKDSAAKLFQDIDVLDCTKVGGTVPEAGNLAEIANSVLKLAPVSNEANPWAAISLGSNQKLAPKDQCQGLKTAIGDANKRQSLLGFIDNKHKENEAGKAQLGLLIEALQKRRGALLQHVSAATAQTKVGDDLWKIILVIGLLSVGTIVVIRAFPSDVQGQWVGSGQVIQFVTVMILLTVIMSLGLAGILKENTLGTLLGGIGGYVLSQGVGKAAAEAVKQGLMTGAQPSALAITALSPDVGPVAGGTTVKITGTGFAAGAIVAVDGTQATVTNPTSTTIDFTTPPHAGGAVDVVVTNPDGKSATAPKKFTYQ